MAKINFVFAKKIFYGFNAKSVFEEGGIKMQRLVIKNFFLGQTVKKLFF